jgi:predicted flavoprotein YhiN
MHCLRKLREAIAGQDSTTVHLDLAPGRDEARLATELAQPRGKRSVSEHLRRHVGIDGVKAGLLYEVVPKADMTDAGKLAHWIKHLPLVLQRPRPLAEAISTAGGVKLDALDEGLMLCNKPGVFCAGEMLDWEAPTGGYLLTASMASGRVAGQGAVDWLQNIALGI